jgi:hypothetical protein
VIEPAHLWIPPRVGSHGDEAIDLARLAGLDPDEEQCAAIDAMASFGPEGRWLTKESAIIEARQNGKTTNVMEPVVIYDLWLGEPDRICWTAHLFRTSRATFTNFCRYIEAAAVLSRRVKKISYSHGEEFIELHPRKEKPGEPGALLEFMARERGGGRGLGGKRVVFDEALILSSDAMDALMPTLSARKNSQLMYGSSAAKKTSTHLHKLIKRGRKGGDRSLIWVEYCVPGSWEDPGCPLGNRCMHLPGTDGCRLDDESQWPLGNHAVHYSRGNRVTMDNIRDERATLSPVGFGRERLGWHEIPLDAEGLISEVLWQDRRDTESAAVGPVGVAVDVSPDQRSAAISMTGVRKDGKRHWQVLRHDTGVGWVAPHLEELRDGVAGVDPLEFGAFVGLDPSGPAGALTEPLKAGGFEVVAVSGRELVQAWGAFHGDVIEDRGRHIDQHTLNQAIRDAATSPSGDVERFSRKKSSGDICPLVSVVVSDHIERTTEIAADPWVMV